MGMSEKELRALANQVASAMGANPTKRHLFSVSDNSTQNGLSALQRDVIYSRVSDLTSQYNLGWLVRQDTMEYLGVIECVPDAELNAIMHRMEIAVECIHEGVPFVERGLVKGAVCNWVA